MRLLLLPLFISAVFLTDGTFKKIPNCKANDILQFERYLRLEVGFTPHYDMIAPDGAVLPILKDELSRMGFDLENFYFFRNSVEDFMDGPEDLILEVQKKLKGHSMFNASLSNKPGNRSVEKIEFLLTDMGIKIFRQPQIRSHFYNNWEHFFNDVVVNELNSRSLNHPDLEFFKQNNHFFVQGPSKAISAIADLGNNPEAFMRSFTVGKKFKPGVLLPVVELPNVMEVEYPIESKDRSAEEKGLSSPSNESLSNESLSNESPSSKGCKENLSGNVIPMLKNKNPES